MNTDWLCEKEGKKPAPSNGASVLSLNSEEESAVGDFTERKESCGRGERIKSNFTERKKSCDRGEGIKSNFTERKESCGRGKIK